MPSDREAKVQDNDHRNPISDLLDHIGQPENGEWPEAITVTLSTQIVRRARAAFAARREEEWQPGDSAPQDGTSIYAWWNGGATGIIRWCGWWDEGGFTQPAPKFWRPLPAPPRDAQTERPDA